MGDTKKHLLLADDHRMFAEGLRSLLQHDFEVGIVEDGWALVRCAVRLQPEVIIADIGMPKLNGIEALRRLRKLNLNARVIILSIHAEIAYLAAALREGAAAYVLKSCPTSELMAALHEVLSGGTYVSPHFRKLIGGHIDQSERYSESIKQLTDRQREVLQLIAEGLSSKEIAATLGISVKTAEFHRAKVMETLDIHSVAGLTQYAVAHGIIAIPS